MSEVVAATAPEVRNLARELVEDWTRLAAELALSSGPYELGQESLNRLIAESRENLGTSLERIRDEPSTREFRAILEQFVDEVQAPLAKGSYRTPKTAAPFVREALTNTIALRDRLAELFEVPIPSRRVAADSTRWGALMVVDVVEYRERIGLLLPSVFPGFGMDALTRVLRQIELDIREAVQRAIATLEPMRPFAEHALQVTGNGLILRFDSVGSALTVAAALQGSTAPLRSTTEPSSSYQFRVGIAFGMVAERGSALDTHSGLAGLPLVVAERMNAVCPPEGIVVEDDAWMRLLQVETPGRVDLRRDRLVSQFTKQKVAGRDGEAYHCWVCQGSQPQFHRKRRAQ